MHEQRMDPRGAEGRYHILMASHADVSIMWPLSFLLPFLSKFYIWTSWVCFFLPAWTNRILVFNLPTEALPMTTSKWEQSCIPCNSRQTCLDCRRPADSIASHGGAGGRGLVQHGLWDCFHSRNSLSSVSNHLPGPQQTPVIITSPPPVLPS